MSAAAAAGIGKLSVSVKKATTHEEVAPKEKHVRVCVLSTHADGGGTRFLRDLLARSVERKGVVCWKALGVLHHVMHEGHPAVPNDAYLVLSYFETLQTAWNVRTGPKRAQFGPGSPYDDLCRLHVGFFLRKIAFHHVHPDFTADFSIEKMGGRSALRKIPVETAVQALTDMLELQTIIHRVQRAVFEQRATTDVKAAPLVPLVVEAFNLYTIEVAMLRRLLDDAGSAFEFLPFLIEKFYSQYPLLRNFFFDCSNVKYISMHIHCPSLPRDAPAFNLAAAKPKAAAKAPQPKPAAKAPAPKPAPAPKTADLLGAERAAPSRTPSGNPFTSSNPFANSAAAAAPPEPAPAPQPAKPAFEPMSGPSLRRSTPAGEQKEHDPFSGLIGDLSSLKVADAAARRKQAEEKAAAERKAAAAAAAERQAAQHAQREEQLRAQAAARERAALEAAALEKARVAAEAEAAQRAAEAKAAAEKEAEARIAAAAEKAEAEARAAAEARVAAQQRIISLQSEGKATTEQLAALQSRFVELEAALAAANERVAALTAELEAARAETRKAEEEAAAVRARVSELEAAAAAAETRHAAEVASVEERLALVEAQRAELEQAQLSLKQAASDATAAADAAQAAQLAAGGAARAALHAVLGAAATDAVDDLDDAVDRLEAPTNLGNDAASAATLRGYADSLGQDVGRLLSAARTEISEGAADGGTREQQERCTAALAQVRAANRSADRLLADVKGLSRKIAAELGEGPEAEAAREDLLSAARGVAEALRALHGGLPGFVTEVDDAGTDAAARERVGAEAQQAVTSALATLETSAARAEGDAAAAAEADNGQGLDLDTVAEKELLAAAEVIAAAAAALLAAQEKQQAAAAASATDGTPQVADAILAAAMAITNAVAMLVKAAADAQAERVALGRDGSSSASGRAYKADPQWSKGLISAAQAVAQGTQTLVQSANDAVAGNAEIEVVVAASKGVSAATAQIVAATRARSDPNGKAQQSLDKAASAVTSAVSQLVAAVRAIAAAQSEAEAAAAAQKTYSSEIDRRRGEMELQTAVLTLERELEQKRNALFEFRRGTYGH